MMSDNCEKLLRAFIEAQGYEVEVIEDIKRMYRRDDVIGNGELKENAIPETIIKTTDYKVTKKITDTSMADAWVKSNIDRGTFR